MRVLGWICDQTRKYNTAVKFGPSSARNQEFMRALVIGASGHVGNAITRALLDRKWEVTACGRHKEPPLNLAGLSVTYLAGDADTPGQLDNWIAGYDLVVDGAAPYPMSLVFPGREPDRDPFVV